MGCIRSLRRLSFAPFDDLPRACATQPTDPPGEVAEWSNAPDSKSGLRLCRNVGSNPTLSAMCGYKYMKYNDFPGGTTAVPYLNP